MNMNEVTLTCNMPSYREYLINGYSFALSVRDGVIIKHGADTSDSKFVSGLTQALTLYEEFYAEYHKHNESSSEYSAPPPEPGYVYLVKALAPDTFYKIGRTKHPKQRIRRFDVVLPFPIEVECLIKTDDMHKLEAELHGLFHTRNMRGEWFELSDNDVAYIKSLAEASHE